MVSCFLSFLLLSKVFSTVNSFITPSSPPTAFGTISYFPERKVSRSLNPATIFFSNAVPQNDGESPSEDDDGDGSIDVSSFPQLYRVRIPRATGIEWGTDLSFSFVYVRGMEPSGPAALSGVIDVGDQLCELRPVSEEKPELAVPSNLVGASFDNVMTNFATLDRSVRLVDLVFFKGTKDELIAAATAGDSDDANQRPSDEITITVRPKGEPETSFRAKAGCNLRKELVDRGFNVYQSVTRWTNCKGKQLCGTCIVDMKNDSGVNTNRKSVDEESTLRENPDTYRLSCVTFCYGDVTVETFPPVNKAQWTR